LNKIVVPGLALYSILSGLGWFLGPGLSSHLLIPWLAGFIFLVFTLSYAALFTKEHSNVFSFIILGTIGLNFLIQITGGAGSPLFPLYFLLTTITAFQHRAWAYPVAGLILGIEAGNLFMAGHVKPAQWQAFAGFSASLSGVAFIASHITHRVRSEAKSAKDSYAKLLSDADAVDPLAGGANVEALTEKKRQATYVSFARERETAFSSLIDMIACLVPAHTYALFLDDRDDGVFSLRGIRSRTVAISSSPVEFAKGNGLIGICAARNQPQYLPDMVIPTRSLGYYLQDLPIKSFLAVPITQGGRVAGVLVLDSLEHDAFPVDTQSTLNRFTSFFSQIIENSRISLEMDNRAKNFAALHDMSQVLSSSLDIAEVLDKLSVQIRSVVPFDFCAFLLYEEGTGDAVIVALKGYDPRSIGSRFPLEQSAILSHMFKQRERGIASIHHDPDLGERGREIGLFPLKELQKPIKSLFAKPLTASGKFIGAAVLGSIRANAFTEYHRNFLDTLLNQVSMVAANSLLHRSIREMARTDGLTGLLNHRTFMEKLAEEHKRIDRDPRPFSILLVDIDFFKRVNDAYGHPVGDVALTRVAEVLKEVVRGSDFVARYGGEEFAAGMVDTDSRGAHQMAERVRKIVEDTVITVGRAVFKITLSIGVASFPVDSAKVEDLVGLSDEALYHAKRTGRNRVSLYKDSKNSEPAPLKPGR
jgi:diguanylate cyclase (GGDEF)-like protein